MNTHTKLIFGGALALIGVLAIASLIRHNAEISEHEYKSVVGAKTSGPMDISITIDGESITLTNGKLEREVAPGSAAKEVFRIFGEPTYGDLNGDGDATDAAMYFTRDSGGSGTFYYVVLAIKGGGVYRATNAMFLGDRIAPQNINIENGNAVANFAERKTGEPFSAQPSVGKSVWVHFDPKTNEIGELVKNFEGEANPDKMTLGMKTWIWVRSAYDDGKVVVPKKVDAFTLTFKDGGSFSATTDCNSMGGKYQSTQKSLTFGAMMSTLMFCDGAQEGDFSSMLSSVSAYHFTSKGELYLEMGEKKGSIVLR